MGAKPIFWLVCKMTPCVGSVCICLCVCVCVCVYVCLLWYGGAVGEYKVVTAPHISDVCCSHHSPLPCLCICFSSRFPAEPRQ